MKHFSVQELNDYLAQAAQPPLLLDVREPWEYDICHLEGSQLLPMGQVPHSIETLDPQRETVVICHHGIRSRQVCYYLEHMGFANVINMEGGIDAWSRQIDTSLSTY